MPFTKKTECIKGHSFHKKNTYIRPDGMGKSCRRCHAERSARYRFAKQMKKHMRED